MAPSPDKSFGERLRGARQAAGFSQSDLSQRSGLPKPTLSRYENGHVLPSLATLRRLADALDVTESALLPGTDPPHLVFLDVIKSHGVEIRTTAQAQELAEEFSEFLRSKPRVRRAD